MNQKQCKALRRQVLAVRGTRQGDKGWEKYHMVGQQAFDGRGLKRHAEGLELRPPCGKALYRALKRELRQYRAEHGRNAAAREMLGVRYGRS